MGSGVVYAVASVAPILSTLLITPIVTGLLGPTEYGVVGIGITLYQLGAVCLAFGLPFAITRHAIIASSGLSGAAALVVAGTAIAVICGTALALSIPAWGTLLLADERAPALIWPLLSAVSLVALTLSQSAFRAVERVYTFVGLSCASAILGPVLGCLSIVVMGPEASSYLLGLAVGHALAGAASVVVVLSIAGATFSLPELLSNMRIGLPTLPHSIAISLLVTVLVVLASKLNGLEDAGRLQLALLIGTAPTILLGAFNNSWAPMIYRATDSERPALLASTTRSVAVLVFALVGGFCVLAQPVIAIIAGERIYSTDLVMAAVIVTAAAPFMALYLANIHLVFLSGKTTPLAVTSPLALLMSLALVLLLASLLGSGSLALFAVGFPAFQLAQWGMSWLLARRSGYPPPKVSSSLPTFFVSFVTSVFVAVLMPAVWMIAIGVAIAAVVVVVANRRSLEFMRAKSGGRSHG